MVLKVNGIVHNIVKKCWSFPQNNIETIIQLTLLPPKCCRKGFKAIDEQGSVLSSHFPTPEEKETMRKTTGKLEAKLRDWHACKELASPDKLFITTLAISQCTVYPVRRMTFLMKACLLLHGLLPLSTLKPWLTQRLSRWCRFQWPALTAPGCTRRNERVGSPAPPTACWNTGALRHEDDNHHGADGYWLRTVDGMAIGHWHLEIS